MSEELQSLVQIIELYGKGLGGLGRALRFSAKGAAKGVQIAQVKALQHRMKLHYASEGTHNTMKLADLEKLTGGRYTILNIPLEGEKDLIPFYDRLKKMKVAFAELPDLNLGDGYTQIAYNPENVENVRMVIEYYKKKFREEAREIDLDEYMGMASPGGLEYLDELAAKGYEGMMHVEQLEEIQEQVKSKDYLPVSINIESLLLKEEKDAYVFRVPKGRSTENVGRAICVKKENCLLLDKGQTVITCFKRDEDVMGYDLDRGGHADFTKSTPIELEKLEKAFAPVGEERLAIIDKLKPEYAAIFPSFHEGQEVTEQSLAPQPVPEETMGKVLSLEKMKEKYQSPEYIPVTFDMETQMVAESPNLYIANLPKEHQESQDFVRCITLDKSSTSLSDDGKRLQAYLKRSESSEITELNLEGKELRKYAKKNEEIATECLKYQRSRWRADSPSLEKTLLEKATLKPTGKKL